MTSTRLRVRNHAVRHVLRMHLRPQRSMQLVRFGSAYGGWWVPVGTARPGGIAYCAGVGEDITFDLELHARGCTVVAIDPVPRAAAHVAENAPVDERFIFFPYGLASDNGVVSFYAPRDPAHVSYSITDLQRTGVATEMPVRTLRTLMTEVGHDRIDLLKIDIEGAEYQVLDRMLLDGPLPPVLCVEFDQPTPLRRTLGAVRKLRASGYRVACVDRFNVTFVLGD